MPLTTSRYVAAIRIHPPPNQGRTWGFGHPPKLQPFFQCASRHSDLLGHLSLGDFQKFAQGFGIPD